MSAILNKALRKATQMGRHEMTILLRDNALPKVLTNAGLGEEDFFRATGLNVPTATKSRLRRLNENISDEAFIEDLRSHILKTSALAFYVADLVKTANAEELEFDEAEEAEPEEAVEVKPVERPKYDEGIWAQKYLDTGNLDDKDKALVALKPLIMKQVADTNVSKSIAHGSLYSIGLGLASKAIDTWEPKKSKLATHVTNQLKRLHRYVNKYGPMLHTPEHRITQWSSLDKAFEAYEHEHGTGKYDADVLAGATGYQKKDIQKAITERRKVFDDSTTATTNIPWKDHYMGLDLDILSKEFAGNKTQKKVFAAMRKLIENGGEGNVKVTDITRLTGLPYREANAAAKEIVAKIKDGLSFE